MTDRERLEGMSERDLREWACESYKDFNGFKARWMLSSAHPIEDVISWILSYFKWDQTVFDGEGCWVFQDDVREDAE